MLLGENGLPLTGGFQCKPQYRLPDSQTIADGPSQANLHPGPAIGCAISPGGIYLPQRTVLGRAAAHIILCLPLCWVLMFLTGVLFYDNSTTGINIWLVAHTFLVNFCCFTVDWRLRLRFCRFFFFLFYATMPVSVID